MHYVIFATSVNTVLLGGAGSMGWVSVGLLWYKACAMVRSTSHGGCRVLVRGPERSRWAVEVCPAEECCSGPSKVIGSLPCSVHMLPRVVVPFFHSCRKRV